MFVACLAINAGECVFLSPGGIGMFDWLLLSLAMFSYRTNPAPVTLQPSHRDSLAEPEAVSGPIPEPAFAHRPHLLRPSP